MRHRNTIGSATLCGMFLLGGCAAAPQQVDEIDLFAELLAPQSSDENVALAAIGQSFENNRTAPAVFHLGAGDALGQAVFIDYVAYCRANGRPEMHYASGSSDASY